jgi:hypothetical protein
MFLWLEPETKVKYYSEQCHNCHRIPSSLLHPTGITFPFVLGYISSPDNGRTYFSRSSHQLLKQYTGRCRYIYPGVSPPYIYNIRWLMLVWKFLSIIYLFFIFHSSGQRVIWNIHSSGQNIISFLLTKPFFRTCII